MRFWTKSASRSYVMRELYESSGIDASVSFRRPKGESCGEMSCARLRGMELPELLAHQDVLHQRLWLHRPVHRAHVRDLQQPAALLLIQGTFELYLALDAVDPAFLRLALLAVRGVYPVLREPHRHRFERPALSVGVHAQRHRRTAAEGREQVVVGCSPVSVPSRLVGSSATNSCPPTFISVHKPSPVLTTTRVSPESVIVASLLVRRVRACSSFRLLVLSVAHAKVIRGCPGRRGEGRCREVGRGGAEGRVQVPGCQSDHQERSSDDG